MDVNTKGHAIDIEKERLAIFVCVCLWEGPGVASCHGHLWKKVVVAASYNDIIYAFI